MEYAIVIYIWVLFVLLGLSAFFSSSETSLFALSKIALDRIKTEKQKTYRFINLLLTQPRRTIISVTLGNDLVNSAFSVTMAYVVYRLFEGKVSSYVLPIIPVVFSWPLLVIFGEIIPKTVAVRVPEKIAVLNAPTLFYFSKLLFPVKVVVKAVVDLISRPFLGEKGKQDTIIDEDFFKVFVEIGREEGIIDESEKELIDRVFVLDDKLVEQIMTPAQKAVSISLNITYQKMTELIKKERYSRIPVYEELSPDKILGILNVKDLLGYSYSDDESFNAFLRSRIKTPFYVNHKAKILDMLRDFQSTKTHIGIVSGDDGSFMGLVTLEDVLEELFGEIKDEYDIEEGLWEKTQEGFDFDLRISLGKFSEILGIETPGDFRTLGQYLGHILGKRPKAGDETDIKNYKIRLVDKGRGLSAHVVSSTGN